jgi:hypothetical protein
MILNQGWEVVWARLRAWRAGEVESAKVGHEAERHHPMTATNLHNLGVVTSHKGATTT